MEMPEIVADSVQSGSSPCSSHGTIPQRHLFGYGVSCHSDTTDFWQEQPTANFSHRLERRFLSTCQI